MDLGDVLSNSFNERLSEKLLLVVDETREGSGSDRYRKANKLQKVITEEHREINPKFGLKSVQYNCCRFLMFSNFMDALPIDDKDRRIRVAYNPETVQEPAYYGDLYETRRDPLFIASVAQLLRERDLTAFNPGLPAPMTDAKRSIVEFMQRDEHRELKALFEAWPADLIGLSDIEEYLCENCELGSVSGLKFLIVEAGGAVTSKRFNTPGSRGFAPYIRHLRQFGHVTYAANMTGLTRPHSALFILRRATTSIRSQTVKRWHHWVTDHGNLNTCCGSFTSFSWTQLATGPARSGESWLAVSHQGIKRTYAQDLLCLRPASTIRKRAARPRWMRLAICWVSALARAGRCCLRFWIHNSLHQLWETMEFQRSTVSLGTSIVAYPQTYPQMSILGSI